MIQVLIVDDDSLLCRAMANKLEYVNQEGGLDLAPAITAGTAREALAIIREKPVDILITDVQMPYQSGLERRGSRPVPFDAAGRAQRLQRL